MYTGMLMGGVAGGFTDMHADGQCSAAVRPSSSISKQRSRGRNTTHLHAPSEEQQVRRQLERLDCCGAAQLERRASGDRRASGHSPQSDCSPQTTVSIVGSIMKKV